MLATNGCRHARTHAHVETATPVLRARQLFLPSVVSTYIFDDIRERGLDSGDVYWSIILCHVTNMKRAESHVGGNELHTSRVRHIEPVRLSFDKYDLKRRYFASPYLPDPRPTPSKTLSSALSEGAPPFRRPEGALHLHPPSHRVEENH